MFYFIFGVSIAYVFPPIPSPPILDQGQVKEPTRGCRNPGRSAPSLTNVESPSVRLSIPKGRSKKTLSRVLIHVPLCLPGHGPATTNQTRTLPLENTPLGKEQDLRQPDASKSWENNVENQKHSLAPQPLVSPKSWGVAAASLLPNDQLLPRKFNTEPKDVS